MPIQTSDNKFSVAKWIVNPTAGLGTHTTITAAMAAASSGDIILVTQGTYTENFTMTPGVTLTALDGAYDQPAVLIVGKITASTAGTYSINNIALQTNSDFFLVVSGSGVIDVELNSCNLICSNNTGISYTNSNSSSLVALNICIGDILTTGITLYSMTSVGVLEILETEIENSGLSTTASNNSAGSVFLNYAVINNAFSTSGTGGWGAQDSSIQTLLTNTTAIVGNGSGGVGLFRSTLLTGGGVGMTINTTASVSYANISSFNTNFMDGNGSVTYGMIDITPATGSPAGTLTLIKGTVYLGNVN